MDTTLREHIETRLRECRESCGLRRLPAHQRSTTASIATEEWWRMLDDAAWHGEHVTERVWRSAHVASQRHSAPGALARRLRARWIAACA